MPNERRERRWKREQRVLEEDKASNDAAVMATTTNPLLFVGVSRGAREKEADEKRFLSEREHREEETKKTVASAIVRRGRRRQGAARGKNSFGVAWMGANCCANACTRNDRKYARCI